MSSIAVVIPTLNEERAIGATLHHLLALDANLQIVVADGGSTDRTAESVSAFTQVQWVDAPKGRARQMNAGAARARGDWLLFLHADTRLPAGGLEEIRRLESIPDVEAGGFRHRFDGDDWRLKFVSWLDNWRCQRTRIIYGDQAFFVRRDVFDAVGGFPERDVLEDIAMSEVLKRRRPPTLLDLEVTTDARKFKEQGVWRSLTRCAVILTRYELGLPVSADAAFFKDVR